jgi:hypothetical protein
MIFVCFLWSTPDRPYDPWHVKMLANAMRHHSPASKLICITDMNGDFGYADTMPTPKSCHIEALTPEGKGFPTCYRRLWLLSDEARRIGDRLMLIDVDLMVTGSLDHFDGLDGDFVGRCASRVWGNHPRIQGGNYIVRPGVFGSIWEAFKSSPISMINGAFDDGWRGSDQAILSKYLVNLCQWMDGGIYEFSQCKQGIPDNACLIQFNGHWHEKPWNKQVDWVQAYINQFR